MSYDNNVPVCMWITAREFCVVSVCIDERLFGNTIFRAEKVSGKYVISDVFAYNGVNLFVSANFKQRYEWSAQLIKRFYRDGLVTLIHKSELPGNIKIKGYEVYDSRPGSKGSFEEPCETINRTEIPDVYTVKGKQGYVLVPDLKTSVYLRSLGPEFQLSCVEKDGNWSIIFPEVK